MQFLPLKSQNKLEYLRLEVRRRRKIFNELQIHEQIHSLYTIAKDIPDGEIPSEREVQTMLQVCSVFHSDIVDQVKTNSQ